MSCCARGAGVGHSSSVHTTGLTRGTLCVLLELVRCLPHALAGFGGDHGRGDGAAGTLGRVVGVVGVCAGCPLVPLRGGAPETCNGGC